MLATTSPPSPSDTTWDLTSTSTSQPAKGRLWVKVVEARNLLLAHNNTSNPFGDPTPQFHSHSSPRPYCVVEFEKNEFVTREGFWDMKTRESPHAHHGHHHEDGMETSHSVDQKAAQPALSAVWKHEATFDVSRPDGEVTITIWDRSGAAVVNAQHQQQHQGGGGGGVVGEEGFLGMMKIRPSRINGKLHDNWFRLMPRQWKEKVKGEIRIQMMYQSIQARALTAADFELLKVVGKGSFGKVLQVRKKDTGRIYAMKVLVKKDIVERQEIAHTLSERNVLIQATSPFLVGLKFSFQTPEKLYLVLDYMNGGELFYHLQKETAFSEDRAKFYTCELVLALEHLHKYNIVYRDLKPENILLDSTGHIALTDFGLCKENVAFNDTTNTFCGTAEYLAPEVLTGQGYGKAVDWWSLGILFYEMTTGLPPFYSENTNLMYKQILHNQLLFPPGFSDRAQLLVRGLLERDPRKRLGGTSEDAAQVRRQPFFHGVEWDKLLKKQVTPPFKPKVESETDTSNFDPAFTDSLPVDSLPRESAPLSETIQRNFRGFTYFEEGAFESAGANEFSP
ncbi:serine/threonine-protein kinase SCH9 [Powellomyces hirtus]|nr:serine/threonine-protein kinase SCH9 [Powellomyces hirtus]